MIKNRRNKMDFAMPKISMGIEENFYGHARKFLWAYKKISMGIQKNSNQITK